MVLAQVRAQVALLLRGVAAVRALVLRRLAALDAQVEQHVVAAPISLVAARAVVAAVVQRVLPLLPREPRCNNGRVSKGGAGACAR